MAHSHYNAKMRRDLLGLAASLVAVNAVEGGWVVTCPGASHRARNNGEMFICWDTQWLCSPGGAFYHAFGERQLAPSPLPRLRGICIVSERTDFLVIRREKIPLNPPFRKGDFLAPLW